MALIIVLGLIGSIKWPQHWMSDAQLKAAGSIANNAKMWVPVIAVLATTLRWQANRFQAPWIWKQVQKVLDDYLVELFPEAAVRNKAKITLYVHKRLLLFSFLPWKHLFLFKLCEVDFCWPWAGWLVPVMRAGAKNKKGIPTWLAPDEEHRGEGFPSVVFNSTQTETIEALPDLNSLRVQENGRLLERQEEYARSTGTPIAFISKRCQQNFNKPNNKRPFPRSLGGFCLLTKGKRWGVVVIDSSERTLPQDFDKHMDRLSRELVRFLER